MSAKTWLAELKMSIIDVFMKLKYIDNDYKWTNQNQDDVMSNQSIDRIRQSFERSTKESK